MAGVMKDLSTLPMQHRASLERSPFDEIMALAAKVELERLAIHASK
jgi:hypothetical protein